MGGEDAAPSIGEQGGAVSGGCGLEFDVGAHFVGALAPAAFGGAHVRAVLQHVGGNALGQRLARRRDGAAAAHGGGESPGLSAGQHRQAVDRLGVGGLERRDRRFGRGGGGLGLGGVDGGGRAGLELGAGQRRRLALRLGGAPGERDARLIAASLDVVRGDVADEGEERGVEIGAARRQTGVGRLERTGLGAEEIDLPARVEAAAEQVGDGGRRYGRGRGRLEPGRRTGAVDGGQQAAHRLAPQGAGLTDLGLGGLDVEVAVDGGDHQLVERPVAEVAPPFAEGLGRHRPGLGGALPMGRQVRVGGDVVGTDGAGGEQRQAAEEPGLQDATEGRVHRGGAHASVILFAIAGFAGKIRRTATKRRGMKKMPRRVAAIMPPMTPMPIEF